MRSSRLLAILLMLQARGRLTARELARHFEVSVRTILRDVDALSAAGVPVYADRGRAGGIALLDSFKTRLTGFTPEEASTLMVTGLHHVVQALGLGEQASRAQSKLMASLSGAAGDRAVTVATRFHLDPIGWYQAPESLTILPQLADAVWETRWLDLVYESWHQTRAHKVLPLGLVMKGGLWYLVGQAGKTVRTYRVASIKDLQVGDTIGQRPAKFDLASFWQSARQDFLWRRQAIGVVIKVTPHGLRLLRDFLPEHFATLTAAGKAGKDGSMEGPIRIESLDFGCNEILRLGGEVEVIEPHFVREAVAALAQSIATRHATALPAKVASARAPRKGHPRTLP